MDSVLTSYTPSISDHLTHNVVSFSCTYYPQSTYSKNITNSFFSMMSVSGLKRSKNLSPLKKLAEWNTTAYYFYFFHCGFSGTVNGRKCSQINTYLINTVLACSRRSHTRESGAKWKGARKNKTEGKWREGETPEVFVLHRSSLLRVALHSVWTPRKGC